MGDVGALFEYLWGSLETAGKAGFFGPGTGSKSWRIMKKEMGAGKIFEDYNGLKQRVTAHQKVHARTEIMAGREPLPSEQSQQFEDFKKEIILAFQSQVKTAKVVDEFYRSQQKGSAAAYSRW